MMQRAIFLIPLLVAIASGGADLLHNPDFETPPAKLPGNSTALFVLLNGNNSIPGWAFEGSVEYVTAGPTVSLPGNGHAIRLAQGGKINQTFIANTSLYLIPYLLTFTLATGGQNCSDNASVTVSAPDIDYTFSFKQNYGRQTWESYGLYLGSWADGESINVILHSQTIESDSNSTCWPVVDTLLLKAIDSPASSADNLLVNGGFETGPDFVSNSSQGILLDPQPSLTTSALPQWTVIGTVKYIDSKHYFIPEGNAAIEICASRVSAGIQTAKELSKGSSYDLKFALGDANNSCIGDFTVEVRAGLAVQNFTLQSKGTGSTKIFSMTFNAEAGLTSISFLSSATSQTKDGVFCGPLVDNVVLQASDGQKLNTCCSFLLLIVSWLMMSFVLP